ncbi:hypothetical protein PAHAL_2G208000 [Panicum hallii]|uniref:Cytochrome P450 n=1 Tax=Panicum hallii TaxID=206008 RepID=A0A2S3GZ06_9POAL|nr:tryptamine 5-hydroxylase-like [Panicum hallii]PAN11703.1 hypothetical protein PAHAL_2G208000 [Panicum hallii]
MELSLASPSVPSLLLLALAVAYVYYTTRWRSRSPLRLPPAPPGWPVIGHLHLLSDMPHHALAELSRSMRAPLLRLRLGTVPAVVISKPELARAALTTHDAALSSRPDLLSGRVLSFGCSDVTYAPSGPYHRMARRVLVSELLSARRVEACGGVRAEEVRRLLAHLTRHASPEALPVDLGECFLNLANDVLCRVAFGRRFPHGKGDRLGAVVEDVNELFGGFSIVDCFPELEPVVSAVTGFRRRLKSSGADLRKFCDDIVDEHISGKRQRVPGDRDESFVDVLLRVQKSPDLEVPLTVDNVKALVRDVFVGGTDATFTTPERVMAELVRHPRALKKAQDEVRRVVGSKGLVEESDLGELHYMRAVIKETLRLHPPVPLLVQRESVAPSTLGGYDIPARTRVLINAFAMGRDPEVWENPLRYSPERFENGGGSDIDFKDADYKMLPFGGGRRGCPGYTFAMATVQLSLASLLYHFEWALPAGVSAMDVNLDESFGLTTRKKEPLLAVVRKNDGYEFKGEELNAV